MTVHKSKGLDYHTVFFLGLDDDQWWAPARDREESTSAFFVGLSRAAVVPGLLPQLCPSKTSERNDRSYRTLDAHDAALPVLDASQSVVTKAEAEK